MSLRETVTSEEKGRISHTQTSHGAALLPPSPLEKVCRFAALGNTFFWIGAKTDLQGFNTTSNQKGVTLRNNTSLLRLVRTLVDFPAWMDLLATTLAQG